MPENNTTKSCSVCEIHKPFSEFFKDRIKKDGHASTCKICSNKRVKAWDQTDRGRLASKLYRQSINGQISNIMGGRKYRTTEKWRIKKQTQEFKELRRFYDRRRSVRDRDKLTARRMVYNAVKSGRIPHVRNMQCFRCNLQAEHYHHTNGYDKPNWFKIIPVCARCHEDIHRLTKIPEVNFL